MNLRKNTNIYYSLAKQFHNARICTAILKAFKKNYQQNVAIYKIGGVLNMNLKKLFQNALFCIKKSNLKTILEESKDFSFMDVCNSEIFQSFSMKISKVFLKFGFEKLRNLIENLTTSRRMQRNNSSYSQFLIEKTEKISGRVLKIASRISRKKEKTRKSVPKLQLSEIQIEKKKKGLSSRCSVLEDEISKISIRLKLLRLVKAWKKVTNDRKNQEFKVKAMRQSRFIRVFLKIFCGFKKFLRKTKAKASRIEVAECFYFIKLMKNSFVSLRRIGKIRKELKDIKKKKEQIAKKETLLVWANFSSKKLLRKLKNSQNRSYFAKKLVIRVFNLFKLSLKISKLSKNHKEIAILYHHDRTSKQVFKQFQKKISASRIKSEKNSKALRVFFKTAARKTLKKLKKCTTQSQKNRALKNFSILYYRNYQKKKFLSFLSQRSKLGFLNLKKTQKSLAVYTANLLSKCLYLWEANAKKVKENKLKNYKSFLIHCKKLIEKSLFGWKKIYPRERYKRLRTIRLQNNQDWNIIDSFFCEWIRATAQRVNQANRIERSFKLKTVRKIFADWKRTYKEKLRKKVEKAKKLSYFTARKKEIYLGKLKNYVRNRYSKYQYKAGADLFFTYKIFRKWNLLNKKRAILKWITSYHYSKFIFTRWKNYSFDFKYSKFSRSFYQGRLKSTSFSKWKFRLKKIKKNKEKLNSYLYYKNLKDSGVYFDKWLNTLNLILLQRYSVKKNRK